MSDEATLIVCNINASYSRHQSEGMDGESLGFAGSVASFCTALLKAYCEQIYTTITNYVFFLFTANLNR